jgi:signal peptidase
MSKNENKLERNKNRSERSRTVPIIFITIFLILILANVSSAIMDCSMCHKTAPGKVTIKAANTIEISNNTCLKCHNPDYPPTPIGYNTHLAHVGKYSAKVDYFARHPNVASFSCGDCHVNIGQNCQNCHVKDIPHIPPPLGYNCKGCHGELDKLFRHPTINLKIHDIFGINNTMACTMCHNIDNMASFKLASGDIVPIQEPHRLCYQCHSNYYNLWNSGLHYSNMTVPSDEEIRKSSGIEEVMGAGADISALKSSLENKWRIVNTCTNCHNPHNPSELYQLPMSTVTHIGIIEIIGSNLLYTGIILMIIILTTITVIFIIKKKKLKLSDIKLSDIKLSDIKLSKLKLSKLKLPKLKLPKLKLPKLKLPKLKLPKISIPISISVEEYGHADRTIEEKIDKPVDKPDSYDKALEMPIDETVLKTESRKTEKKNFLYKYRKDIYFILAICIMLGSFYVIFGAFMPMTVVVSESMSPHIEKGDIVFYTDISRIDKIRTYNDNKNYTSIDSYGDVILYRPLGEEGITPYIHRAMYYVNEGDDMWQGGPKAPHAGYITKGDNDLTNPKYDQQGSISLNQPIKKEWIVGVARFRIPYIGYIRLMLP